MLLNNRCDEGQPQARASHALHPNTPLEQLPQTLEITAGHAVTVASYLERDCGAGCGCSQPDVAANATVSNSVTDQVADRQTRGLRITFHRAHRRFEMQTCAALSSFTLEAFSNADD